MALLSESHRATLKRSLRTLVIFGKFSQSGPGRVVLDNEGDADGIVDPAVFFDKLKPELRSKSGDSLLIEDTAFNVYDVLPPLTSTAGTQSLPLLIDSPLLQGAASVGSEWNRIQSRGGNLFKRLLEDLDVVVRFSDSRFTKAILLFAKHYVYEFADQNVKQLGQALELGKWGERLAGSPRLQRDLVRYLTCHEDDAPSALGAFQATLTDEQHLSPEVAKEFAGGLSLCRITMSSPNYLSDPTYQTLLKANVFKSWLGNYPNSSEYGITLPDFSHTNFIPYYHYFRRASDNLHRVVRSKPLHPYFFAFLASRYAQHDSQDYDRTAAKEMYNVGIDAQGSKRVLGETAEQKNRNRELLKSAQSTAGGRAQIANDRQYQSFSDKQVTQVLEALSPKGLMTIERLERIVRELFVDLAAKTGGTAGQILESNKSLVLKLVPLYRAILNLQADKGKDLTIEDFRNRLQALADDEDKKECTEKIFSTMAQTTLVGTALREALREACVSQIGITTKTKFDDAWLKDLATIKSEEEYLNTLADHRLGKEVKNQQSTTGIPLFTITRISIPETAVPQNVTEKWNKAIEAEMNVPPGPQQLRVPRHKLLEGLPAGTSGKVVVEGNTVAGVKLSEKEVEYAAASPSDLEKVASENAELVFGEKRFTQVKLGISKFVADAPVVPAADPADVAKRQGDLTVAMDRIVKEYAKAAPDGDIHRDARAMALAEYMLAAPPAALSLNVDDLSNVLGVMVEMVRHVGDRTLGDKLFASEPLADQGPLRAINLSEYYPVVDESDFRKVFKYHYDLSEKLKDVQAFLSDVGEVRDLLRMLRNSSTRVIIYNQTFAEHDAYADDPEKLFAIADPARVLYVSRQAPVEESTALCDRVVKLFGNIALAKQFVLPILVSPVELPAGLCLPRVDPGVAKIPALITKSGADIKLQAGELAIRFPPAPSESESVHLQPYLLLASVLSLPQAGYASFGMVTSPVVQTTADEVKRQLGVTPSNNLVLAEFLRQIWLAPDSPLVGLVILSTWINFASAAVRSGVTVDPHSQFFRWIAGRYSESAKDVAETFGALSADNPALGGTLYLTDARTNNTITENAGGDYPITAPVKVSAGPNNAYIALPRYSFLEPFARTVVAR